MSFRLTPTHTGASNSRASTASTASATSTTSTASTTSTTSSVLAASLAASAASVSSTVSAAWSACGRRVRTTKTKLRRRLSARGRGLSRTHSSRRAGPYWSLDSGARNSVVIYLGEAGAADCAFGGPRGNDATTKDRKKGAAKTDRVVVRSYAVSADDDDDDDCAFDCNDDGYAYTWTTEASKSAAAAAVASALAAYHTVAGPDDYDKNWI